MGVKLNLGSGTNLKQDFINVDLLDIKAKNYYKWDLSTGTLPPIENIDYIYSCHFLEHLTWKEGVKLLEDCHRKLSPGGEIRLVLPDFKKMVTAYLTNNWSFWLPEVRIFSPNNQMMEIMNYGLYQRDHQGHAEHKTMYDVDYAIFTLQKAGFKNCREDSVLRSHDEQLELRTRYSLYIVGIK